MRLAITLLIAIALIGMPPWAGAQGKGERRMQWCAAMGCEEEVIRTVVLDTVIRDLRLRRQIPDLAPRIVATLYQDPFRVRRRALPVAHLEDRDWVFVRRLYPDIAIVESAEVAFSQRGVLSPGGPLFVMGPVSWRGDSAAVVRLAVFPAPQRHSSEHYVRVEYREQRWTAVRISTGLQE